jgi:hydroxylamine dehydrogenase
MRRNAILSVMAAAVVLLAGIGTASAVESECENCHAKLTPMLVTDFNRGVMSETMGCADCHGEGHSGMDDAANAELPTIATCQACHEEKAEQYLAGKHAKGLLAVQALPFSHGQPDAFVAGQRGCGGCHTLGLATQEDRKTEARQYYKYGMDCQNCHTRHAFSVAEAREPEACQTCHQGFDHPQWEMWSTSKHGVAYLLDREAHRGPTCQDCHMAEGDHRVRTPWGFLGVRLPEEDEEWMGYRATILMGLGVLDAEGQPTAVLDIVKAGDMARLDADTFAAERKRITDTCGKCHSQSFWEANIANGDQMLKEADKIFAEAINIVAGLRKDGIIEVGEGEGVYPQLLSFYEVETAVEQHLYDMFMDYRMKTFQGAFHINPDYTTWYGYAKMKQALAEIKELDHQMREWAAAKSAS